MSSVRLHVSSSFNWAHSLHTELKNASHSTNVFANSCDHSSTNGKAPLHCHVKYNTPQILYSLWRRANARNVSFLHTLAWWYSAHFGWWGSHGDDILTPHSRSIGCYWSFSTHILGCLLFPSRGRGNGWKVRMVPPIPLSLSLEENNTSAKVWVEGYLDNAYADLRQHCRLCVIWVCFAHITKAAILRELRKVSFVFH